MSFSSAAGTAIVPTLSRLVLAAAFTFVGYNKVFTESTFDGQQAAILDSVGAEIQPAGDTSARADDAATTVTPVRFSPASMQEDPGQSVEEAAEDVGQELEEAARDAADAGEEVMAEIEEAAGDAAAEIEDATPATADGMLPPPLEGEYTAKSLHKITLMLYHSDLYSAAMPSPVTMAWIAGLTELIGGALVLIGFLTRLWGLALAGTMVVAFMLTSMEMNGIFQTAPWEWVTSVGQFNTAVAQLSLFVLAFGLVLTGAGPLSIDRLLFGGGHDDRDHVED